MTAYLFKVTLTWGLLLFLFEVLFQKSGRYTGNRVYLLGSLLLGIMLPLIVLPFPEQMTETEATRKAVENGLQLAAAQPATAIAPVSNTSFSPASVLWGVYLAGAVWLLVRNLRDIVLILRQAIYGRYQAFGNLKLFITKGTHAPYSFMGWIFITRTEGYTKEGLRHILQHEEAHNRQKHWIDMLLMQAVLVVFWFHPLVWRFRYLLRLQHEYEADHYAARGDAYQYGHFLLEQTLLKGTPAVAHSFHFSPIKKRITMLTHRKSTGWKYLAVIPVLLCCTLLTAKPASNLQRAQKGNEITFKGNTFYLAPPVVDSIPVMDPVNGETTYVVSTKDPVIIRMGKDSVYWYPDQDKPQVSAAASGYAANYLGQEFKKQAKDLPENLMLVAINHVVLDEEGRVVYYDISYRDDHFTEMSFPPSFKAQLDKTVDDLISKGPEWKPALVNGRAVKSYFAAGTSINLKPLRFKATKR